MSDSPADDDGDGIERPKTTVSDQLNSRRGFLAGTAAVGTSAMLSGSAFAQDDNESDGGEDGEEMEGGPSDVDILNFALTLEFLEARFYRRGLDNIGEEGLRCSDPLRQAGGSLRDRAFDDLRVIQEHEEAHAETIAATIEDLGGDPAPEPEFDFGTTVEDPTEFLATAATLEATGTGAYAGAAPEIENAELIPPALSIHSVEARHTSFLNVLNGEIGFPNAFDEALGMDEVLERAGQFIVE